MKRMILFAVILAAFAATSASASPQPCDCYGGIDPYATPTYWYLLDYLGYPLEDGDCATAYWVGPDGMIDGIDVHNPPYPAGDDSLLNISFIEYSNFVITATTWGAGEAHPALGESIYCVIFDDSCASLGADNYYAVSNRHACENFMGENFFAHFPGDPGGGHTDTPLPVELASFTAMGRDGEVLLEWVTASENGALGFHIKRGQERITTEVIPAAGNSAIENTYTYVDKGLENGVTYGYYLITVDIDGVEKVANKDAVLATPMAHVPSVFALHQNYPNPFNPLTEIKYDLTTETPVTVKIFNVLGEEVATLVDGVQKAGYYSVSWNAEDLASGVYFCALNTNSFKAVRKMVFLK